MHTLQGMSISSADSLFPLGVLTMNHVCLAVDTWLRRSGLACISRNNMAQYVSGTLMSEVACMFKAHSHKHVEAMQLCILCRACHLYTFLKLLHCNKVQLLYNMFLHGSCIPCMHISLITQTVDWLTCRAQQTMKPTGPRRHSTRRRCRTSLSSRAGPMLPFYRLPLPSLSSLKATGHMV